ncbi:MAG: addiction module protein [Verrucomicrobia bacterium]|nr:addiction module protein [Verrucomicrobiota bacterium]
MPATLESLEKQALKLPATSRVRLAERILESVEDYASPDVAAAWDKEIARRVKEIKGGKVEGIPAEEVSDGVRRKLYEARRLGSARQR